MELRAALGQGQDPLSAGIEQPIRERNRLYLSPDSTSNTRRLGSSERRAARTQPAVPAGDRCRLGDQDEDKGDPTSSYNYDVVLGVKQLLNDDVVGVGNILEVLEEARSTFSRL